MLDILKYIEKTQILNLLNQPEIWKTKLIDYEPPIVERVYTEIGDYRLSLHFIHPCDEAFIHPHVWKSAMHIIEGSYEMGLYYPNEKNELECVSTIFTRKEFYYEMLNKKAQHYVKPIDSICKTVMLTGKPIWKENGVEVNKELVDLTESRKNEILDFYKLYYKFFN